MNFSFHGGDPLKVKTDLLVLLAFEEKAGMSEAHRAIDRALGGFLGRAIAEEQFKAKKGQALQLHTMGRVPAARLLVCGMGPQAEFKPSELRGFGARAMRAANAASAKSLSLLLPIADPTAQEGATQFIAEGLLLGRYKFDKFLPADKKAKNSVAAIRLVLPQTPDRATITALQRAVRRGEAVATGVARARDLVNEPADVMTPQRMADVAREVAKEHGLTLKVLGPKECRALGMGMYLAVAQGSDHEPRFIHLTYRPKAARRGERPKRIALIGKGVTFDSGGLSLKPSASMEDMKIDMSGAAAVISAIGTLASLGVPHEVHAIAACTENMPSGRAYKLGDVLRSMSGKTVEINNTDAEGRLTLGDALTYALREVEPDELFDFATLTGACMVALGPHIAGVMGNNQPLSDRWLEAARRAGEDMWQLPLPERLKDQLKSEIADMRNTGERYGGALTAGLFLREFAGETPWVHVDLAGPASSDKEQGHQTKGGTGFGVATIVEYLAEPPKTVK